MIVKKDIREMACPKISIIMAAKDEAKYIAECIESILNQTFDDWELIVIDDHSIDGTDKIIQKFSAQDKRVQYYLSEGKRLNAALLTGQKHIQGELVNRMDADDIMPLYKLELMYNTWVKHGSGHIAAGGTKHFVDDGEVGGGFQRYDDWLNKVAEKGSHWQEIYRECVIPSHCWLISASDFVSVGGFANTYPEDYDLCFRFYKAKLKVIPITKVLHYWRDTEDRISRSWDEYKDNRFFDLKVKYFIDLDYKPNLELVIWGAGRNGKDLVKLLKPKVENGLRWVSNNPNKIGKDIYGITIEPESKLQQINYAQVLIVISGPKEREIVSESLNNSNMTEGEDYWFFI